MRDHIKLTPTNVLFIGAVSILCYGAAGATLELVATKTNIPVVTPLAKGLRHYVGWSFAQVTG